MARKREISNNELIMLSVTVFFVSVIATIGILNPTITGYAETGYVNVTVTSVISITLPTASVLFVNQSAGTRNDTIDNNPPGFNISNNGNTYVNVTVSSDKDGSTLFVGGSVTDFAWNCTNRSALIGQCYLNGSGPEWANVTTAETTFIDNLNFSEDSNWVEMEINISVPSAESAGTKEATLTFTAYPT